MKIGVLHDPQELQKIGEVIRETRTDKKFSQRQLADKLGMPASILSDIEKGKRLVPKKKVPLFIKYLNLKENQLLPSTASSIEKLKSEMKALESEIGVAFRDLRSLPDEAKKELIEHYKELKEKYETDGNVAVQQKPADVAWEIIRTCRLNNQIPVDLHAIAKKFNISIEASNTIDSEGWILCPQDRKWASIKYKKGISLGRQRFTIAHEMGHYFLKNLDVIENSCFVNDGQKNENERAADEFASNLLMPEKLVRQKIGVKIKGIEDVLKINQAFEVSQTAAAIRLVQLSSQSCAVISAREGIIKWGYSSSALYLRVKKDEKLSRSSQALKLTRSEGSVPLSNAVATKCEYWFHGNMTGKFWEQSLKIFPGETLSLIWKR